MSLYKKYTHVPVYSDGHLTMMGVLPTSNDIPVESPLGSIYLVQDTGALVINAGAEWQLLSDMSYVDVSIPPQHTEEELDYINNVKPFIEFVGGTAVKDKIDLVRGLLKVKKRSESSRFNLLS